MERIRYQEVPAGLIQALLQVETYIKSTGLDGTLCNLIKVRASQINGCAHCLDMHTKEALHAGETVQRLLLLEAWHDAPMFTPKEKAVLAFTEKLTRIAVEPVLEDNLHDELKQFFSTAEIANLSLVVAQINAWNRVIKSLA
jgi:AhpD family alkylhydroperoxidase